MAKETVYNNTLVSGAADETLTYTRYVKDESSGKSTKELLDEKVNKTDQLGTTQIADKSVTTEKLENESVTTDKLDAASVTTEKVADANITTSKLADSSVETEKINNKAVTTDKLNDGAVDNSKLSPNAVTSEKIKDESIITEKLNDRAVTTEKVEEKAITNAKLGDQSVDGRVVREASLESKHFSNESVTTEKVARKSITKDKLADNAVDASQVVDGSIDNAKLSPDSVTTEKIKDGSVTNEKIADNTLGIGKLDPELRKTIQAATGLPEDLTQMIQDIDQSVKQLHEKDTDLQSQIDDKQQQITANDEDISLLQTRSTQMEETIKSIAATGGASQATAVTYNNEKSKLAAVNIQSAVDEVVDKTAIKNEEGTVVETPFRYIQNEEFIFAKVDAEDKLLFGIQWDGTPVFGKTSAVEDRLQSQVNLLADKITTILGDDDTTSAIDTLKELKDFFANIDNTHTLTSILANLNSVSTKLGEDIKNLQDTKVDKEEGKSLIDDEVKECFRIIENEEFIKAIVDSDDKVLFGFYRATGKPYYPLNEMYHVIQNEEYFAAWVTTDDKVVLGLRRDGQIIGEIHAVNALKQVISQLQSDLASLQEKVDTIDTNLKELLDVFSLQDNEEYLAVEQDSEGKILSATNPDGSKTFYTTIIPKSSIKFDDRTIYEDEVEDYKELLLDSENKMLRYTDKNGVIHENREIVFSSANLGSNESVKELAVPRSMNLPKYGYTDIKEETFYLTANEGYSDKNGILAMLVYEDTQANAQKGLTPYKYFVKSTLQNTDGVYSVTSESVSLNFYVPSDVKEVGGKFYVTSSLTKGSDGSYTVNPTSIEVTKIVDKPNVGTWEISKKTKHWCVVDIDFGSYLKGTYNVLVSFQGASTLYNRQKNLRYAFVKSDYKSKVKLKIGELLKVDKFNLKSYYSDDTKLKEPIIFRLYLQAKELRNFNEQYPWSSSSIIATGATGIIKSFPVCTSVGGEFYGVQFFGYKKDEVNYMLSGDEDGMILSGGVGCNWAKFDWSTWEDEMNDEPTESNRIAVEKFYQFINGSDFTKENAPKHMNINDWIDYFIFIQLFRLRDNDIHNLILYSGADKKIFSPFLYDLDLSFFVYSFNLEAEPTNTVWLKLKSLYWEEICARYKELRSSVLTQGNFNMIVSDLQSSIDYSDFEKGVQKWGIRDTKVTTGYLEELFGELLKTFDVYFNLNK